MTSEAPTSNSAIKLEDAPEKAPLPVSKNTSLPEKKPWRPPQGGWREREKEKHDNWIRDPERRDDRHPKKDERHEDHGGSWRDRPIQRAPVHDDSSASKDQWQNPKYSQIGRTGENRDIRPKTADNYGRKEERQHERKGSARFGSERDGDGVWNGNGYSQQDVRDNEIRDNFHNLDGRVVKSERGGRGGNGGGRRGGGGGGRGGTNQNNGDYGATGGRKHSGNGRGYPRGGGDRGQGRGYPRGRGDRGQGRGNPRGRGEGGQGRGNQYADRTERKESKSPRDRTRDKQKRDGSPPNIAHQLADRGATANAKKSSGKSPRGMQRDGQSRSISPSTIADQFENKVKIIDDKEDDVANTGTGRSPTKIADQPEANVQIVYPVDDTADVDANADSDDGLFEEDDVPVYTLRKYQEELAEKALEGKNTIVCCGTGSGKTLVAYRIIDHHLQQPSAVPRKVVFMAKTTALMRQQAKRLKRFLPKHSVRLISGEDDNKELLYFLDETQVFCMTPQILINNLGDGRIESLSKFSLLIFDECHHAKGAQYHVLLTRYLVEKSKGQQDLPQILGLTASIGVGKAVQDEEAVEYILKICAKMDVREMSVVQKNIEELKEYTNHIEEEHIPFLDYSNDRCKLALESAIRTLQDHLGDMSATVVNSSFNDLIFSTPKEIGTPQFESWINRVIKCAQGLHTSENNSREIITCAMYMRHFNAALEMTTLLNPKDVYTFLAGRYAQEYERKDTLTKKENQLLEIFFDVQRQIRSKDKGQTQENQNVRTLCRALRNMLEEGDDQSRAMVFVHARATCRALATFLNNELHDISMPAKAMWGKQSYGLDKGMTEEEQTNILEDFRSGRYKVLVATSVAIEGIDVPSCDIVISYKYTKNEITKTQMKGRSRRKGKHTTIGDAKDRDNETVNVYKIAMMERALKKVVQMEQKEIDKMVKKFQEEELSKYEQEMAKKMMADSLKVDDEFILRCSRCDTFACSSHDIRKLDTGYVIIDKTFGDRIDREIHPDPKRYNGFLKKYKMFCKKCPLDWGVITEKNHAQYWTLKIGSFQIYQRGSSDGEVYLKWAKIPFKVMPLECP